MCGWTNVWRSAAKRMRTRTHIRESPKASRRTAGGWSILWEWSWYALYKLLSWLLIMVWHLWRRRLLKRWGAATLKDCPMNLTNARVTCMSHESFSFLFIYLSHGCMPGRNAGGGGAWDGCWCTCATGGGGVCCCGFTVEPVSRDGCRFGDGCCRDGPGDTTGG